MSSAYLVYDNNTGKILKDGVCPLSAVPLQAYVVGTTGITHSEDGIRQSDQYINLSDEAIIDRPDNTAILAVGDDEITADGIDEANITNIPLGSTYTIRGSVYAYGDVSDTTLDFSTDTEGKYTITIESFPEKRISFIVEAV